MQFSLLVLVVVLVLSILQMSVGVVLGRYVPFLATRVAPPKEGDPRRLYHLVRRLRDLAASVAKDVDQHQTEIQQANEDLNSVRSNESGDVADAVLQSVTQILQTNQRLKSRLNEAEEKLQDQTLQIESHILASRTDPLTGLPNRRAFDDEITRRIAEWRRKEVSFCLMIIDIDHFKNLNDRHGHLAGDHTLRTMADVFRRVLREMDLPCRIGGEEFAVILPDTKLPEGKRAAERVRLAVASEPFLFEQTELPTTISLGLAVVEADEDPASLLKRADDALYAAKHAGRNCSFFHNGRTCEPIRRGGQLAAELLSFEVFAGNQPDSYEVEDVELTAICDDLRQRLAELADPP